MRIAVESRARALIATPELARYFNPANYRNARNELAILDRDGNLQRIDRLVEFEDTVWVLDYKTGDDSARQADAAVLAAHRQQLAGYAAAATRLYPGKRICAAILLADGRLVEDTDVGRQ